MKRKNDTVPCLFPLSLCNSILKGHSSTRAHHGRVRCMKHQNRPFRCCLLLLLFVFLLFFFLNNNNNITMLRGIQQRRRRPFFTNAWVLKSVVVPKKSNHRRHLLNNNNHKRRGRILQQRYAQIFSTTTTTTTSSTCQLHRAFGGADFSSPRCCCFCCCYCRLAPASSSTKRFLSSRSSSTTTTTSEQKHDNITTAAASNSSNEQSTKQEEDIDNSDNTIYYNELKLLSNKIRYHDDLYYNSRQQESTSASASASSAGIPNTNNTISIISDEEYDALVDREEWLCINYPSVLQKWEDESGLGKAATRYGGQRVGAVPATPAPTFTFPDEDANDAVADTAATEPSISTTSINKRIHLQKMLSLDNVHTTTELLAWMGRVRKKLLPLLLDNGGDDKKATSGQKSHQTNNNNNSTQYNITIVTEPKLDGLGLSLRYAYTSNDDDDDGNNNWTLRWASTRGDGKQGLDVTAAVRDIQRQQQRQRQQQGTHSPSSADESYNYYGVPQTLPQQNNEAVRTWLTDHGVTELEVRGEVVLPNTAFKLLKNNTTTTTTTTSDGPESESTTAARTRTGTFSNARNAAAGILLRKEQTLLDKDGKKNQTDDQQEEQTKYLRSQLRFYAYEIVFGIDGDETMINNNDGGGGGDHHPNNNNPLDDTRSLLETWGFAVPQPSIETNLTVAATAAAATTDEDDEGDARLEWNESDISATMLNYYNQLQLHREQQQQQQQQQGLSNAGENYGALDQSSTTPTTATTNNSEWTMQLHWDDYDMDGCVHKIGQANLRRIVGASARTPRWAIAHKFPSHLVVTSLQNVAVQVGRTGALTPVAELQPVEYNGVIISRATLHNFQHLQQVLLGDDDGSNGEEDKLQIPKGTLVMVRRAGDVIPQVVSRVYDDVTSREEGEEKEDSKKDFISLDFPKHCPACGSDTVFENISKGNTSTNSSPTTGQILRCGGPALLCPPRAALALQHAYSRDGIEIKGLSEARIRQLMDAGLLKIPSDIFQLVNDPQQLKKLEDLEGWGPKSKQNLVAATTRVASEGVSLARFIYSLGIRYAGVQTSELIAAVYGNIDAFLKDLEEAPAYEMSDKEKDDDGVEGPDTESFSALREENGLTKGLGPVLLNSLVAFSKEKDLVNATRELSKSLLVIDHPQAKTLYLNDGGSALNKPLRGMSVVFTGSVPGLTRKLARQAAKELGAKSTPTTLSKSTNLIVIGEKGGSKKLEQAESLGVRTMNAKEFQEMVDEYKNK